VQNRARFALEVIQAVTGVWGDERVGIKFSPCSSYNGMKDEHPYYTYKYILEELSKKKLSYIHISHGSQGTPKQMENMLQDLRPHYNGLVIGNEGFNLQSANEAIEKGVVDMVSFG
jgi:N-ethylmaleimide reductase